VRHGVTGFAGSDAEETVAAASGSERCYLTGWRGQGTFFGTDVAVASAAMPDVEALMAYHAGATQEGIMEGASSFLGPLVS
jgi:hypothetical protein